MSLSIACEPMGTESGEDYPNVSNRILYVMMPRCNARIEDSMPLMPTLPQHRPTQLQLGYGNSPFFSRSHSVQFMAVQVIVPGHRPKGDSGSCGSSHVQPEWRGRAGGGARGGGGTLLTPIVSHQFPRFQFHLPKATPGKHRRVSAATLDDGLCRRTLVVLTAPFRTTPTARAVGRHDLANMLSTIGLSWRVIDNRGTTPIEWWGSRSRSKRRMR